MAGKHLHFQSIESFSIDSSDMMPIFSGAQHLLKQPQDTGTGMKA
jgi:hypothetical protein